VRTLSAASTEYVWARVTDLTAADISTSTLQLAYTTDTTPPATWYAPQATEASGNVAVRIAALLIGTTPHDLTPGTYLLWYRLTDTPEDIIDRAGYFEVRA